VVGAWRRPPSSLAARFVPLAIQAGSRPPRTVTISNGTAGPRNFSRSQRHVATSTVFRSPHEVHAPRRAGGSRPRGLHPSGSGRPGRTASSNSRGGQLDVLALHQHAGGPGRVDHEVCPISSRFWDRPASGRTRARLRRITALTRAKHLPHGEGLRDVVVPPQAPSPTILSTSESLGRGPIDDRHPGCSAAAARGRKLPWPLIAGQHQVEQERGPGRGGAGPGRRPIAPVRGPSMDRVTRPTSGGTSGSPRMPSFVLDDEDPVGHGVSRAPTDGPRVQEDDVLGHVEPLDRRCAPGLWRDVDERPQS